MKCCVHCTHSNMVDIVGDTDVEDNSKGPLDSSQLVVLDGVENHTSAVRVDMVVPNTGVDMAAADGVTKNSAAPAACLDIQHMDWHLRASLETRHTLESLLAVNDRYQVAFLDHPVLQYILYHHKIRCALRHR